MVTFKTKSVLVITFIVIALILMLSLYFFVDPASSSFFPQCPFYKYTKLYCPGCGSQRAMHDILQGHIISGIRHNYLWLLVAAVLLYQGVTFFRTHYFKPPKTNLLHNGKITRWILILVITFWILRNIPVFPFIELAP